jgi:hypothetical protein
MSRAELVARQVVRCVTAALAAEHKKPPLRRPQRGDARVVDDRTAALIHHPGRVLDPETTLPKRRCMA